MTELEKMEKVKPQSQAIGEFLEWLREKGWVLAEAHKHGVYCLTNEGVRACGLRQNELLPCSYVMEVLLAEYFEIDLNKVEEEKRAILEALRQ